MNKTNLTFELASVLAQPFIEKECNAHYSAKF